MPMSLLGHVPQLFYIACKVRMNTDKFELFVGSLAITQLLLPLHNKLANGVVILCKNLCKTARIYFLTLKSICIDSKNLLFLLVLLLQTFTQTFKFFLASVVSFLYVHCACQFGLFILFRRTST